MAALGSGIISYTALDKTLGVRPPDTLIVESSWVVAPGASLGKLFVVYFQSKCIEKYQVVLCSKCDRGHDFEVAFE